jgi:hypothetical protein
VFQYDMDLECSSRFKQIQGGSNMTGTDCDLFTHNQSRSYLNHLVFVCALGIASMVMV